MSFGRFYAKIELDSIGKNVSGVRSIINDDTMIMAVINGIKGNETRMVMYSAISAVCSFTTIIAIISIL